MSVMNPPPIQYARAPDGASIAYWVMRNGPSAVVHVPYPVSHLSNEWKLPEIASWYERLGTGRTLVAYDARGMGLSAGSDKPLAAPARDLKAVMDAAGVQRVALLASWVGAWTALVLAALHPERVSHLVLWGAATGGSDLYTDSTIASAGIGLVDRDQLVRVMLHSALGWSHGDTADRFADILLDASDQTIFGSARHGITADEIKAFNIDHVAARLDVPTLVLHPRGNQMISEETAARLAATIPNARLMLLDGDSLFLPFGVADQALEAINSFLAESSPPGAERATSEIQAAPALPATGPPYPDHLSEREVEVLRLVAAGNTNAQIAEQLVIAPGTVARHVSNILHKTDRNNRTELATYAVVQGLVAP